MRTPHDNPPDWMLMLTAYIDESGYGARDIIVMGGFLGTDEQWAKCAEEWKIGLGKRRSLHMKDLRWKGRERVEPLLKTLGPIPHNCGLIPAWVRIQVSDYSDLIEETTVSRKLQGGYLLAAQSIGIVLLSYAQMVNEKLKIVFEYNDHFAQAMPAIVRLYGQVFPFILKDGTRCLTGVELVTKDSSSLTQPADYLAYARLQKLRDPASERSRLCSPILDPQSGIHAELDRQSLRNLMSSRAQTEIRRLGREVEVYLQIMRKCGKKS